MIIVQTTCYTSTCHQYNEQKQHMVSLKLYNLTIIISFSFLSYFFFHNSQSFLNISYTLLAYFSSIFFQFNSC